MLGKFVEQFLGVDDSARPEKETSVWCSLRSRWQMIIFLRLWLGEYLMTGIRSANTHKQIVLGRDMSDDIALALASILAAD